MTTPPSETPRKQSWALLFSTKPKRLEELVADFDSSQHGRAILRSLAFDEAQARSIDDARGALRSGTNGVPHAILIIGGELAAKMKSSELERLRGVALNRRLLVMGLADNEDERRALDDLDISWILRRGAEGVDHFNQFSSAQAEMRRRIAEENQALAATPNLTIIKRGTAGILGSRAVMAVHATKGGVGKTSIAANLSWGLSEGGQGTVLVDFNVDSAHIDRIFGSLLFSGKDRYENREQLFETKGLSWLAGQIRHDNASQKISPQALNEALLPLYEAKDQHLYLLPGIYDQTDYEGGSASPTAALLSKKEWINEMIGALHAPAAGWDYVVIDTGIARYTSFARIAVSLADLFVLVVNASSQSELDAEAQNMDLMLRNIALGKFPAIKGKKLIVANMIMPRETQFAPRLADIKRQFEFFGAEDVIPVAFDMNTKLVAEHERRPVLSISEKLLPETVSPMKSDLRHLVNVVAQVYERGGAKDKKRGFGGLFGRS